MVVILAAAEHARSNETIPILYGNDDLGHALFGDSDEEDDEREDDESARSPAPRRRKTQAKVGKIIGDKTRDELLDLLNDLSGRSPQARQHVIESGQIASGQVDRLARAYCDRRSGSSRQNRPGTTPGAVKATSPITHTFKNNCGCWSTKVMPCGAAAWRGTLGQG